MTDDRLIRKIFSQIIAGYSLAKIEENGICNSVYIKHFSSIDFLEYDYRYEEYLKYAINRGLFSEEEKVKTLINENLWSPGKESDIEKLKEGICGAVTDKRNHYNPNEINAFNLTIKNYEKILHDLLLEKYNLIGETAESFARRKIDVEQIFDSFYFDREFNKRVFENPEQEGDDKLDKIIQIYSNFNQELNDSNLKRVAISQDFQSTFNMCENLYYFWGRAATQLTEKQNKVTKFGQYYKHILGGSQIPDDIKEDPDKIDDWAIAKTNINKLLDSQPEDKPISLVGISAKELNYLGIKTQNLGGKIAKEAAKNANGEIDKETMYKLGMI